MLTYLADPADEAKLKSLHDEDEGFRFWGPVFKTKDGKRKLRFVVPEPSVPKFNGLVGKLGTLVSSSRRNQKLIDSVTTIRLAITEDFWQDTLPYPPLDEELWWEIWLRGNRQDANETFHRFVDIAAAIGINRVSDRYVSFPERLVLHAYASARQLSSSMPSPLHDRRTQEGERARDPLRNDVGARPERFRRRCRPVSSSRQARNAPSVCILDAGVNQPHPLLAPALAPEDVQAVEADWGTADHDDEQHGTGMAGIALYGCLTGLMTATGPVILRHRLESVKFLPPPPQYNEPPVYGRVMQDAVALAQIQVAPPESRHLHGGDRRRPRDGDTDHLVRRSGRHVRGRAGRDPQADVHIRRERTSRRLCTPRNTHITPGIQPGRGSKTPASRGTRSPSAPTPRRSSSRIRASRLAANRRERGPHPDQPHVPPVAREESQGLADQARHWVCSPNEFHVLTCHSGFGELELGLRVSST